ncbi:putative lipid II flippase FtsW [Acidihalobacter ferrooxydans]|uniref:Probable peptidoglycan glycosyltransferase FtsW n=1 Tax=Acidihalobacter ferrooxydans TaxID=1765967 RepID=A0A1P8UE92_9GAMM|nr:putative lipid II flippase FtsW [Acidihalobacter ferrooxydans]
MSADFRDTGFRDTDLRNTDLRDTDLRRAAAGPLFGTRVDLPLLLVSVAVLCLGLVMVESASISVATRLTGNPFYYFEHQVVYAVLGVLAAWVVYRIPLVVWQRSGMLLLLLSWVMLALVLIPHLGHVVNGSRRWIGAGPINIQVSELAKLFITIYLADYLVRRHEEVRNTFGGFLKPMLAMALAAVLLLKEPDYGSAVVLLAIGLGMLFLAGARLKQFGLFLLFTLIGIALLAVSSPYRVARLTSFLDPWADPYNAGFQLTQSLIAIGSGSWFGVGLGDSIQKLFYLPEAYTDFLFAVLAEELGLIGAFAVIALYAVMVVRGFHIGRRAVLAAQPFAGYLAYGIAIWLGLQAFINIGVNMGLLPTKGLTLPLMSYGGSSMVVNCMALGFLQRAHRETVETGALPKAGGRRRVRKEAA